MEALETERLNRKTALKKTFFWYLIRLELSSCRRYITSPSRIIIETKPCKKQPRYLLACVLKMHIGVARSKVLTFDSSVKVCIEGEFSWQCMTIRLYLANIWFKAPCPLK